MRRIAATPRADWQKKVLEAGLAGHSGIGHAHHDEGQPVCAAPVRLMAGLLEGAASVSADRQEPFHKLGCRHIAGLLRASTRKPYHGQWLRSRGGSSRSDIALPGLAHGWRARIQMRRGRGEEFPGCWKVRRDRRYCRWRQYQFGPVSCGWGSGFPGLARTRRGWRPALPC
jgi:hypothetical protein